MSLICVSVPSLYFVNSWPLDHVRVLQSCCQSYFFLYLYAGVYFLNQVLKLFLLEKRTSLSVVISAMFLFDLFFVSRIAVCFSSQSDFEFLTHVVGFLI